MRFLFLGTGTSAGVPMIGCACAVCTSADPRDSRLRTAGAVRFKDAQGLERVLLLDAGPDLRTQALRARLMRCDAILLTHNHVDHVFGLDEVRRFNAVQRSPIDVHADEHTMASLRRVYQHIFEKDQNVNDSFVATLVPRTLDGASIRSGVAIDAWGMRCTPIELLHGKLPVLGWRIEPGAHLSEAARAAGADLGPFPLAYCTDVSAVPPQSWARLRGLKTLVLDCLRERHHPTHLTLQQAVDIAAKVDAQQTYFVHMSHDLPHEATQARLPERMALAWDGLELGTNVGGEVV